MSLITVHIIGLHDFAELSEDQKHMSNIFWHLTISGWNPNKWKFINIIIIMFICLFDLIADADSRGFLSPNLHFVSLTLNVCRFVQFYTSAKEVMFSSAFVCLFVSRITLRKTN